MLARFRTFLNCAAKATTQTPAVMQEFSDAQHVLISQTNASTTPPSIQPSKSENSEAAIEQAKHVKSHRR